MAVRHILFPTDFSDPARHAGAYAAALARGAGARVTALHVLVLPQPMAPPGADRPSSGHWLDLVREAAEAEAARAQDALRALRDGPDFRGVEVRLRLATGPVEHEILRALGEDPADVVVMGTHGRGLVGRAVLGGVTAKVVRLSPRPVLAVRWPGAYLRMPWGKVLAGIGPPPEGPRFARILVALDGSALAETILPQVQELVLPFRATLVLARAVERPAHPMVDVAAVEAREGAAAARYLEGVRAALEGRGFRATTEVLFGDPAAALLDHAAKAQVDAIAMATHGRGGLDRWLLGSVAEKVLSGSGVPVFLFRAWSERP